MQFYLLSPLFILLYVKGVKAGLAGVIIATLISTAGMLYGSIVLDWSALTLGKHTPVQIEFILITLNRVGVTRCLWSHQYNFVCLHLCTCFVLHVCSPSLQAVGH